MPLPDTATILIVGAGPTGLAVALSLLHHGFRDFVIVDAVERGENTSRALALHAATLEALDTIGSAEDIVAQGARATNFQIGTRKGPLICLDTSYLKSFTRHAYVLTIPQTLTEHVLGSKLANYGIPVHRPLRVVGIKPNAKNPNTTDVAFENGKVITAKYVVGADGARSVIRTAAGIGFSDPLNNQVEKTSNLAQMVLADVTIDDPEGLPFSGTLSSEGYFLCVPIPSTFNDFLIANGHPNLTGQLYRIVSGVPLADGEIPHAPGKEYLQSLVNRFGPYALSTDPAVNPTSKALRIEEVIWSTRYRNHAAIADTPFVRLGGSRPREAVGSVVLLVGDAAHVHSPAGAQGMNLGLRDAIFLGEALIKHMRATETESVSVADKILLDYAATRHARALEVIQLTKGLLSTISAKEGEWAYWWLPISAFTIRNWMMWLAGKIPFMKRRIAWQLSGLGRR